MHSYVICKSKAVPTTGREGLQGCEILRIPHLIDNLLTYGGNAVSPMHRPRSTRQKHYFSASGTQFCYRLSEPQGLVQSEGLGTLKKFIQLEPATFSLVA
jgi:hypothetical protein